MQSIIIRISEINRKNNTLIVHPMSSKQLFPQNLITSSLLLYSSLTLIDGFMSLIHSASSVSRCTSPRRVLHTMSKFFSVRHTRASLTCHQVFVYWLVFCANQLLEANYHMSSCGPNIAGHAAWTLNFWLETNYCHQTLIHITPFMGHYNN